MKRKVIYCITAFLIMALLPLMSVGSISEEMTAASVHLTAGESKTENDTAAKQSPDRSDRADAEPASPDKQPHEKRGFKILDTSCGKVVTVDEKEFCCGALGYEMAPLYEIEALKAQCTACYTHFCMLREKQQNDPDPELKGADLSADLSKNQIWLSDDAMKKKWGNLYERSRERINKAVDECFGKVLCDDKGGLIDAAYFALSSGNTENSKDIFGFDSPYLRSVPSPFDLKAPDQISKKTVSRDDLLAALKALNKEMKLPEKADGRTGTPERTNAGSVLKIRIGSCEFTGAEIREAFGLRSSNFDVTDNGDSFELTVRGYGHGVGMSQYGANSLAQQGSDYKEILRHYYGDAHITDY